MLQQLWNRGGSLFAPRISTPKVRPEALDPLPRGTADPLDHARQPASPDSAARAGTRPTRTRPVGPSHIVEAVNETLAIYNKSTGALISSQTLQNLFSGFDADGGSGMFDPSVMYDEGAGRFVLVDMVNDSANHLAYIDLAVSNSSDPTQGFTEKQQIEVDEGGNYWVDNGKLGFNNDAIVFTGNSYTFSNSYAHELVLPIDKSTVLDQNPGTLTKYIVDRSGNFSMIPARMHGSAAGGPMWFVETTWSGGSSIDVVKMTNVLSSSPSFTDNNKTVNSYSYVSSPPQPGGTVSIVDQPYAERRVEQQ